MKHSKNLVLIGMPGSGKSTIGKIISEKLKMEFIDTDDYIEKKTNLTVSDLFKNGEEYFRLHPNKSHIFSNKSTLKFRSPFSNLEI